MGKEDSPTRVVVLDESVYHIYENFMQAYYPQCFITASYGVHLIGDQDASKHVGNFEIPSGIDLLGIPDRTIADIVTMVRESAVPLVFVSGYFSPDQ